MEYSSGRGSVDISKETGIPVDSIIRFCRESGIGIRSYKNAAHRLLVDESCFDLIDTEEKAYWLGFISADGCITGNSLTISLALKDIDHLKKIKSFTKSQHKIGIEEKYGRCSWRFRSDKVVNSLVSLGVTERKSLTIVPCLDRVDKRYTRDYWRGFVDGDGHVSPKNYPYGVIGLCGTLDVVKSFCEFIVSRGIPIKTKIRRTGNIYSISIQNKFIDIYRILYKDSKVYLDRKFHEEFLYA